MTKKEINFLRESNAIEFVFDEESLHDAQSAWEFLKKIKHLTVKTILTTHHLLMVNQPISSEEIGSFRRRPVWIGGMEAKPWYAIPELVEQWVECANNAKSWEDIQHDHVMFEEAHPFIDGNGRTGRLLMNWQRQKLGLPILVIKEAKKDKYYEWFK